MIKLGNLKLSIKDKLVIFAIFSVLWVMCEVGIGMFFFNRIQTSNQMMLYVNDVVKDIKDIRIDEKTYLQHYQLDVRNRIAINCQDTMDKLNQVSNDQTRRISDNLVKYLKVFERLVIFHNKSVKASEQMTDYLIKYQGFIKKRQNEMIEIQAERQMEGEDLNIDEQEFVNLLLECSQLGLQVETIQQKYLMTSDKKYLEQFETLLSSKGRVSPLDSYRMYALKSNDKKLIKQASDIKRLLNSFVNEAYNIQKEYNNQLDSISKLEKIGDEILSIADELFNYELAAAKSSKNAAIVTIIVTLLLGAALFAGASTVLVKMIINPLNLLLKGASLITDGDLSKPIVIDNDDELGSLGKALENMRCELNSIVHNIIEASKEISSSTEELSAIATQTSSEVTSISEAMNNVADATTQQVGSVQEITSDMSGMLEIISYVSEGADNQYAQLKETNITVKQNDESIKKVLDISNSHALELNGTKESIDDMADLVNQVVSKANSVEKISLTTSDVAQNGKSIVLKTVDGMVNIKEAVEVVESKIMELGKNSSQIGEIIELINDIAEQTNLLALNAAIEAARAGTHGRGFAVVADEIRKLAERVTFATKDISGLINTIQKGTDAAVISIREGTKEVQKGSELIEQTKEALDNISDAVADTVTNAKDIAGFAKKVSKSSSGAATTMQTISAAVQENAISFNELLIGFSDVVKSTSNTQKIAQSNQSSAVEMQDKYEKIATKIDIISTATTDNSSVTEEVVASTAEINDTMQKVNARTSNLLDISKELSVIVDQFTI